MLAGKTKFLWGFIILLCAALVSAQPTTQPDDARGTRGRGEMLFQRLHEAMDDLKLTDDQKTKIDEIFTKAQNDVRQLAPTLRDMDRPQRQQKIIEFMQDVRQKISDVLTDEQKQQLQEKIQKLRQDGGRFGAGAGVGGKNQPAAAASPQSNMPPRIQQTLDRLDESLKTLQLSDAQKSQVKSIVDDGKKQLAEMREKVQAGTMKSDELRGQAPQVFAAMRDQLAGVLTRDQQEKLRDAIQSRFDQQNASSTRPAMMNAPMEEHMRPRREEPEQSAPAEKPETTLSSDHGTKIGEPAPELSLDGLNGRTIQLASFKNKPLVIEFGSYTSPSFRHRAAKMEELARQYSTRANFLVVYTKEAHAAGEWEVERNLDDGVKVAKHADLNARKSAAKDARQALRITIPIALDSMDDAVSKAFGAGENSAIVLGRDGTVVAKEMWCDPVRLRAALDEAVATRSTSAAE